MRNPKSNEENYQEDNITSAKRTFGTVDPDYISTPDVKKLKLLEEKGEEELCERVTKIVEKEFNNEIATTEYQLEEIDKKLLKVQQYLHTLRYLGALEYFTFDQIKCKSKEPTKLLQQNHPAVRRYINNAPSSSSNSVHPSTSEKTSDAGLHTSEKRASSSTDSEFPTSEKISSAVKTSTSENGIGKLALPSICIPKQPESKEVIVQGRKGRFQKKVRIIVGNTYQYLQDAKEYGNELKFKWRVYVRGPPEYQDVSNFISNVIFTLDKSYAPHDVIKISEFPFSVSRRGWGEFKIHLELNFCDPRNKAVKLLHYLRLSRNDDPLALTGLWRLGEETWYDIWLYDKSEEQQPKDDEISQNKTSIEHHTKELIQSLSSNGIKTETIYSDSFGNCTLSHVKEQVNNDSFEDNKGLAINGNFEGDGILTKNDTEIFAPLETRNSECISVNGHCEKPSTDTLVKNNSVKLNLNSNVSEKSNEKTATLSPPDTFKIIQKNRSGAKGKNDLCKILIRQADGKLVSCMVPKEMYDMAVKLSSDKNLKTSSQKVHHPLQTAFAGIAQNLTNKKPQRKDHNESLANVNNTLPINTKKIVFKTNTTSTSPGSSRQQFINLKGNNQITNIPGTLNPALQKLTLRMCSPINGNIRLQTATNASSNGNLIGNIRLQSPTNASHNGNLIGNVRLQAPTNASNKNLIGNVRLQTATNAGNMIGNVRLQTATNVSPNSNLIGNIRLQTASNVSANSNLIGNIRLQSGAIPSTSSNLQIQTKTIQTVNGNKLLIKPNIINKSVLNNDIKNLNIKPIQSNISSVPKYSGVSNKLIYTVPFNGQQSTANNLLQIKTPCNISSTASTSSVFTIRPKNSAVSIPNNTNKKIFITQVPPKNQLNPLVNDSNKKMKKLIGVKNVNEKPKSESPTKRKESEEYRQFLKKSCSDCKSNEEAMRLLIKLHPIIDLPNSFIENENSSHTIEDFARLPLGRQKAIEFWRARQIRKELQLLKLHQWEIWNTKRIISWLRKRGFSILNNKTKLQKDVKEMPSSTLTVMNDNNEQNNKVNEKTKFSNSHLNDSFVIVDDNEEETGNKLNTSSTSEQSNEKETKVDEKTHEITPETLDGCHFVQQLTSKLRIKITEEEAAPGVTMDLAANVMWKATLCFMEDLLRSSYAASVDAKMNAEEHTARLNNDLDTSRGKNGTSEDLDISSEENSNTCIVKVEAEHVRTSLINGRSEFDLLSGFGLGKFPTDRTIMSFSQ